MLRRVTPDTSYFSVCLFREKRYGQETIPPAVGESWREIELGDETDGGRGGGRSENLLRGRGPVPLEWLSAAASLPGKIAQMALVLWFSSDLRKSKDGWFTPIAWAAAEFGLSRQAAYKAMQRLAEAGLVELGNRQQGRKTRVRIVVRLEGNMRERRDLTWSEHLELGAELSNVYDGLQKVYLQLGVLGSTAGPVVEVYRVLRRLLCCARRWTIPCSGITRTMPLRTSTSAIARWRV